jgi:hypothetical protein
MLTDFIIHLKASFINSIHFFNIQSLYFLFFKNFFMFYFIEFIKDFHIFLSVQILRGFKLIYLTIYFNI